MKRLRKLKNNAGFSLAEMLMAVLILLMVSMIVATGMPAARNAYEKTVIGANAQAMLSTAVSALRDELGTAWDVQVSGTTVTYFKADTGTRATIQSGSNQPITRQDYLTVGFIHDSSDLALTDASHHLVPDKDTGLYATYDGIEYNSTTGIVTITGLKVCKENVNTPVANLGKDAGGNATKLEIKVFPGSTT